MISEVIGVKRRIGIDSHPYVISMFQALQGGWVPPTEVSEEEYNELKKNSETFLNDNAALRGFVGIGCSYSGKWFGGYARGNDSKGNTRNYARESADNLMKQAQSLKTVEFYCADYKMAGNINDTEGAIIYCDPPYAGTTKYSNRFNHTEFWAWCDEMSERGFKVFVSEYNAPQDWRCIWEKSVNNSLTKDTGSKKGVEKLFTK